MDHSVRVTTAANTIAGVDSAGDGPLLRDNSPDPDE